MEQLSSMQTRGGENTSSESLLDCIRHRAEQHSAARAARWRRLGLCVPNSQVGSSGANLPRVSIVLATHRLDRLEQYRRYVGAQDFPNLELIIVLNNDAYDEASVCETFTHMPRLQVLRVPADRNLGTCINLGVAHATGEYITKMDDDDFYGPSYISDLLLSALESGADITGKKATFFYFEDGQTCYLRFPDRHDCWLWPPTDELSFRRSAKSKYSSSLTGGTLFIKREVFRAIAFDESAPRGTDGIFGLACRRAGMTIYASDEFNYCYMRRVGGEGHLWQIKEENFLKSAIPLPSFQYGGVCV
jgi:glycosyltransferase involved in cell wall biosynthesis